MTPIFALAIGLFAGWAIGYSHASDREDRQRRRYLESWRVSQIRRLGRGPVRNLKKECGQ